MFASAILNFTVGTFLAGIGVLAMREVDKKRELFFAAAPLLFGVIQLIEGMIWLSFGEGLLKTYQNGLSFAVVFFAYALWPVYSPTSVWAIEPNRVRRTAMFLFVAMGYVLGFYFLQYLLNAPFDVTVVNDKLHYSTAIPDLYVLSIPYLAVVFGPYLLSSSRMIFWLGVVNITLCAAVNHFFPTAFLPIWIFFASIFSAFTYVFFLRREMQRMKEVHERWRD